MLNASACFRSLQVYRTVLVPGLALSIIAGCGGGDDSSSSSDTSKPATSDVVSEASADKSTNETPDASNNGDAVETPSAPATSETVPSANSAAPAAGATGSFAGSVLLDGDAPDLTPLVKAGDQKVKDKEVCGVVDVPDESLVVSAGGGIANVFVYLRRAPKGHQSDVPSDAVVLDQKGCLFLPHVALIRAGQKVLVKSSDAVQHNVHTFPARNQGTNLLINPNEQDGIDLVYDRPETDPLQVKCDIHAWMSSYHLVLDHPFMAVTDADGKFQINGLPSGDYEFRIWHERGGLLEKAYKATVTAEAEPVTLKYSVDKFPAKG